jgi:hypothetical protein
MNLEHVLGVDEERLNSSDGAGMVDVGIKTLRASTRAGDIGDLMRPVQ